MKMNGQNPLLDKSYGFALRMIKVYRRLCEEKREFILSKQLVRAGTSIIANVEEAIGGYSEKDFLFKISVAYKEAREGHCWLRLMRDSGFLEHQEANSMLSDCEELLKLSGSTIKTIKQKLSTG